MMTTSSQLYDMSLTPQQLTKGGTTFLFEFLDKAIKNTTEGELTNTDGDMQNKQL